MPVPTLSRPAREMSEVARLAAERATREKIDIEEAVREEINDRGCSPLSGIVGEAEAFFQSNELNRRAMFSASLRPIDRFRHSCNSTGSDAAR